MAALKYTESDVIPKKICKLKGLLLTQMYSSFEKLHFILKSTYKRHCIKSPLLEKRPVFVVTPEMEGEKKFCTTQQIEQISDIYRMVKIRPPGKICYSR